MKEQKILTNLKEQYSQVSSTETLVQWQKMSQFIDAGISRALAKEGEEKVSVLVTTLMNLRDFMTSSVLDNSFKARLLSEIQQAEQEHDSQEESNQQQLDFDQEDQKKS
tara:strand:+ start:179 stop:505 length:327 start_codon:yes stop_codon:yes gene_type:complete